MVRIKTNRKSAGTRKQPATPRGFTRWLVVRRARALIVLLVVGLLGWGMHAVWQQFAPQISQRENYLLTDERITISPPPEWITGDVRGEAVRRRITQQARRREGILEILVVAYVDPFVQGELCPDHLGLDDDAGLNQITRVDTGYDDRRVCPWHSS